MLTVSEPLAMLNDARPFIPEVLISKDRYERLLRAAKHFPPCVLIGLECRLKGDGPCDIWICPGLEAEDLKNSASWLREMGWPPFADIANSLEQGVPWPANGAWTVEFDMDSHQELPMPSSFVTFGKITPKLDIFATVKALWKAETGKNFSASDTKKLFKLLKACPSGELAGFGILHPRPSRPVRLMLSVDSPEEMGMLPPRDRLLVRKVFGDYCTHLVIAAALDRKTERRFSIEGYIKPECLEALIDNITALGLCLPEKAQALLELARHEPVNNMWCSLNHLKLSIKENGSHEIKAYPSLGRLRP